MIHVLIIGAEQIREAIAAMERAAGASTDKIMLICGDNTTVAQSDIQMLIEETERRFVVIRNRPEIKGPEPFLVGCGRRNKSDRKRNKANRWS